MCTQWHTHRPVDVKRETLPSARSDGDPLRRFSTLYTGMKWCMGRRQSTERFVGRLLLGDTREQNLDKFHLFVKSRQAGKLAAASSQATAVLDLLRRIRLCCLFDAVFNHPLEPAQ